ncbi:30S ribosomal protein S9 [Candidatus Vidania fulgoroideorum]
MIGEWYYGIGKKKSSISKVFLKLGKGEIKINKVNIFNYFKRKELINNIYEPLYFVKKTNFNIYINSKGGGEKSKAISSMIAISRAICDFNIEYKKVLKKNKLITFKNRKVEKKKYGYVKSRKKKQYTKR